MQFAEVVSDPRNAEYLREIGVLEPLPAEQEGEKHPAPSGDISEKTPNVSEGSDLFDGKEPEKAVSPEKSNA